MDFMFTSDFFDTEVNTLSSMLWQQHWEALLFEAVTGLYPLVPQERDDLGSPIIYKGPLYSSATILEPLPVCFAALIFAFYTA